jgi:hypothetical protein
MPLDLLPALILVLTVAVVASAMELRSSLRPPVCPQCVHCRHEALAKKAREERDRSLSMQSFWGPDDADDDRAPRR